MAVYKCFKCGKETKSSDLGRLFSCSCGSRIFFKPRTKIKTLKAD